MHKTRELELTNALMKRGHTVKIVAMTSKGHSPPSRENMEFCILPNRYLPILSSLVWVFFLSFYLPLHLLKYKPKFVIMNPDISILGSVTATIIARLLKTYFILDIRSTPVEVISLRAQFSEIAHNISLILAKRFFSGMSAVSLPMKLEVCRKFGLDKSNVDIWTNGVPIELFDPSKIQEQVNELKKKLGLSQKFVVFYHGAFSENRGLYEAIDAIHILRNKYPDILLLLVGNGPTLPILYRLIEEKNLVSNVIIHKPVSYEQVPQFIGVGDICLVPLPNNVYWRYQNALNLLEYLAMEKVILASNIYANYSVMGREKFCILIDNVAPLEIARSIEYAYENIDTLADLAKVGRKIIQRSYTWDKIAEKVESYLAFVASNDS